MRSTALFAAILSLAATIAHAEVDEKADYVRRLHQERGQTMASVGPYGSLVSIPQITAQKDRQNVARALAAAVERRMGRQWVATALKIAKVESGFNCAAVGPRLREGDRALGLGQMRLTSARALGFTGSVHALRECSTGIRMMIAHMEKCEQEGARTEALMARCHVAGWGSLKHRLKVSADRYARKYALMVHYADRRIYAMN